MHVGAFPDAPHGRGHNILTGHRIQASKAVGVNPYSTLKFSAIDCVNHVILMDRVARRISDKRLLRLIRAHLNAGVREDGLVSSTDEGVLQGGPYPHQEPKRDFGIHKDLPRAQPLCLALTRKAASWGK